MFMKSNRIKHIRCAPYHPSSNGAVERFVQTFKRAMKASAGDARPLSQRLSNFLLSYHSTLHATTNRSPSELFLGRRVRTRLDLLRPSCDRQVDRRQAQQEADHDRRACSLELFVGQQVMARNLRPGAPWIAGVVIERLGPLTYLVQVDNGQLWKRHLDHLRIRGHQLSAGGNPQAEESADYDFSNVQESSSLEGQGRLHPHPRLPTRQVVSVAILSDNVRLRTDLCEPFFHMCVCHVLSLWSLT